MKDLYKDIGSFMIRTPGLPINLLTDNIENATNIDHTMFLFDCPQYKDQFNEAIFVASQDLYESMQHYIEDGTARDTNYLLNSIYKYFSRSCSRCTPFGLFSTVAFGNITSDRTSFELSSAELKRNPLIDSEWLYQVVFLYETKYLKSLRYTINESVAIQRNKAILFNCTKDSDGGKVNKKSVKYSNAFEIVLRISGDYVSYSDIIENLKIEYPNVEENTFHIYIQSLIKEGYLISDLRPPLTIVDQFQYFICKLQEYDINTKSLVDIQNQIQEYSIGHKNNTIESLTQIFKNMKRIYNSKNYLTIDSSISYSQCNLNQNEIKKINKLLNLFIQFNIKEPFNSLNDYKNKFLEKYGLSRCVPLTELIDPDIGIGFPAHYDGKNGMSNFGEYINPWIRFFERKYVDSVRLGKEIEITDTDMGMLLTEDIDLDQLPQSMEIYFNYVKDNGRDVYYLSNIFGSTYAGKSFGRFSHLMNNPEQFFEEINKNYGEECQVCEFTYLPDSLYSANVIRNMHGSTYETSFGTTNSKDQAFKLKLSEILVEFKNNKLYLKSAVNNKRIIPTSTNMFNPQLKPRILRLIDEISSDGIRFYNKPWQYLLEKFAYLPTIRYKNFVLEQEKWIIKIGDLGLTKHYDFAEFKNKFIEYINSRNIPLWVDAVDADKKLLLNLKEDRCLSVLQKLLEKSETVVERYHIESEQPVKLNDSSYCCELVIPLILDPDAKPHKANDSDITRNYGNLRYKEPLDEWLYFKIYGIEEYADYLLGEALYAPLQKLLENKEIDSYFFIQYKDPDLHLRLRLKADNTKLMTVLPKMLDILSQLMKKSLISNYSINCYELELERYGGYDLMNYAHEVFYKDSMAIQTIIHEKNNHNIKVTDELLASVIIFFHMRTFNLSFEDMFVFLNCENPTKSYQKEFREHKDTYVDFVIKYLYDETLNPDIDFILKILSVKFESMKEYLNRIEEYYPVNKAVKLSILDSLLHMNMNRLFGPNTELEKKMRTLARHTYYCVYSRKKIGILGGK
ncbi:thiopeptide-type bacteriocin biosynthesis protein [Lacrimispora xylanisolvens]|uniref:Thiopeptide-type bacteriocin biosynthesis protein n=1 Tax=Lacrimispora xylanisolvens TaxID=384636 RepID=A0A2S6HUS5_9FIRM|nr:lantibiotic dehydratase [Hungatella xylanolytica]PPK81581.1 thiopeptide-type bacteriocin biosynthesis protein [Hungatella xylanolytica]